VSNGAIRLAAPSELPLLSELAFRSKAYWGYSPSFMAACRRELTVRAEHLPLTYVKPAFAKPAGPSIAGFYTLSKPAGEHTELDFLFVEPWAIRRGYGRELLMHASDMTRELGRRSMRIQGDPHAARFYERVGAVQIGTRVSDSIPGRLLPLFALACPAH
jgi:GNAT superfamily N-acetyltransferase